MIESRALGDRALNIVDRRCIGMGSMKRKVVLTGMAAALRLPLMAGEAVANTPPAAVLRDLSDAPAPFERPDFLGPKNLSACEWRHLGGPWSAVKIAAAELKKLHAALDKVRQACAAGRDEYLP